MEERVDITSVDLLARVRIVKMDANASADTGLGKLLVREIGR